MDNLFNMEITGAARFIIAFVVVLVLIAVTAWLVRRFGSGSLGSAGGRGRQPRLAVIDAATVDARRKLILVRRDNVEHLVMIGGPTDVVIEPNIVRAAAATREVSPGRTAALQEPMSRPAAYEETTMWPLQPEPATRPQRSAPAVAAPQASAPMHPQEFKAPQSNTVDGLADEFAAHAPARREPELLPLPASKADANDATAPVDDRQLAEMAQRLEAVLRRPAGGEPRLDIPVAEPPVEIAAIAPPLEPDAANAITETAGPDAAHPAAPAAETATPPREAKKFYETIEQEMASLLGRPTGKT